LGPCLAHSPPAFPGKKKKKKKKKPQYITGKGRGMEPKGD
jgi:hypothetical protein